MFASVASLRPAPRFAPPILLDSHLRFSSIRTSDSPRFAPPILLDSHLRFSSIRTSDSPRFTSLHFPNCELGEKIDFQHEKSHFTLNFFNLLEFVLNLS